MKLFSFFIITFPSFLFSQNLVFFNDEVTITFKENELININGQKYKYQEVMKNRTQIHLQKSGFLRKENLVLETNKIETFRTFKVRFSHRNALNKAFSGFKKGFVVGGILGFGLGYDGLMGSFSKVEEIAAGIFVGSVFGTMIGTIYGAPLGFIYGFLSPGESKLYNANDFKIKFDDKISSNSINQE